MNPADIDEQVEGALVTLSRLRAELHRCQAEIAGFRNALVPLVAEGDEALEESRPLLGADECDCPHQLRDLHRIIADTLEGLRSRGLVHGGKDGACSSSP